MDTKGIILIIIDMVVIVTVYSWAICYQIEKEKKARSKENEPNKQE